MPATTDAAVGGAHPEATAGPPLAVLAAIAVTVIGMMLVIGGVLVTGLFLPGAVLIGVGLVGFAAAAILDAREDARGPA
jgi:hypothetical protein